jgi:hypothetical protein
MCRMTVGFPSTLSWHILALPNGLAVETPHAVLRQAWHIPASVWNATPIGPHPAVPHLIHLAAIVISPTHLHLPHISLDSMYFIYLLYISYNRM